jgi:hypothetical protein
MNGKYSFSGTRVVSPVRYQDRIFSLDPGLIPKGMRLLQPKLKADQFPQEEPPLIGVFGEKLRGKFWRQPTQYRLPISAVCAPVSVIQVSEP